jgi:ATP-dependent RNA helicase DeaD
VQGTVLGKANADIEHQVMHVRQADRFDAAINVLLRYPEDKTLLFVRTRTETVRLADELSASGLAARALNGEMTQRERTATFTQFRNGTIRYLVATDVAARGLDVQDIGRVIQVDLPDNADVFTHRAGRTGRAGRRGTNVLFAAVRAEGRVRNTLRSAGVDADLVPIPTPEDIFAAADERLGDSFLRDLAGESAASDDRATNLAERLLAKHSPEELVACLLKREAERTQGNPRQVRDDARRGRSEHKPRKAGPKTAPRKRPQGDFVTYQVSWGGQAGADARKLLAMVCRRGDVTSEAVGAIRVSPKSSTVDITVDEAARFESAVARPDKRNPRAQFRRWDPSAKTKRPRIRPAKARCA